jgi:hypothetical protein
MRPRYAVQSGLDQLPDAMGLHHQTVEHVFGTLKSLTRTLEIRPEMALAILAYNMPI